MTDRYTKAIEQLGSKEIDVRIGGIYALERIARDSASDHPTVMEVLAAFVRDHSPEQWPLPAVHEAGAEPPERETRPDVHAAASVIGRRTIRYDSQPINLQGAIFIKANLAGANLSSVHLTGADFTGALLVGAHLERADLRRAHLERANLTNADLFGADLTSASLERANLTVAELTGANLTRANLYRARFPGANLLKANLLDTHLSSADLSGADFTGAFLSGAFLSGADLSGALWPPDEPAPQGWQRDTDSNILKRADANSGDATAE